MALPRERPREDSSLNLSWRLPPNTPTHIIHQYPSPNPSNAICHCIAAIIKRHLSRLLAVTAGFDCNPALRQSPIGRLAPFNARPVTNGLMSAEPRNRSAQKVGVLSQHQTLATNDIAILAEEAFAVAIEASVSPARRSPVLLTEGAAAKVGALRCTNPRKCLLPA